VISAVPRGFEPVRKLLAALSLATLVLTGRPVKALSPTATPSAAPGEATSAARDEATELFEATPVFVPGVPAWVPIPGDKPALVVHGPSESNLAIVYLHGLCGNVRAIESFSAASARYGTVIALLGDRRCPGGRFKWGKSIETIAQRVDRALRAVRGARGGRLDLEHPVLFGYSQGAARAEQLVAREPERYQLVVLGGPPREPKLPHLGGTTKVAVLGGERETTGHMRAGTQVLAAAGKPVRFFLLPAAKHGEFGPEGNRVIDELLSWLLLAGSG
jgi:pimeloyl-ACP methyl ester carboxylesterase